MRETEIFQAVTRREPTSEVPPRVELMLHGELTGVQIDGAVLERQFELDGRRYLLFVTDNVPYEETLRVYLLDDRCQVMDGLEFGGAFATGTLENVKIEDLHTISFSFAHKKRCRVRVLDAPRLSMPLVFTPGVGRRGPRRPRHHLLVEFVDLMGGRTESSRSA